MQDLVYLGTALIPFMAVCAVAGAIIEWQENRRARKKFRADSRQAFPHPRRQDRNYVQEWDELLESLEKEKSA